MASFDLSQLQAVHGLQTCRSWSAPLQAVRGVHGVVHAVHECGEGGRSQGAHECGEGGRPQGVHKGGEAALTQEVGPPPPRWIKAEGEGAVEGAVEGAAEGAAEGA
eukprot:scaffold51126_cov18-Phaeocystis_antarctica.AAC.1